MTPHADLPKSSDPREYVPLSVRHAGGLVLDLWQRGQLDYEGAGQVAELEAQLRDAREVTDEMVERAWRAFDGRAAGGADAIRGEAWFEPAIREAVAAALTPPDAEAV